MERRICTIQDYLTGWAAYRAGLLDGQLWALITMGYGATEVDAICDLYRLERQELRLGEYAREPCKLVTTPET